MLDAIIISSFILAAAGVGFYSTDLLPNGSLDGVTNLEALRLVVAAFAAIIGGAVGLIDGGGVLQFHHHVYVWEVGVLTKNHLSIL